MYDFITVSVWYQNPNYDHIYNVIQIKYDFIHVMTVTIFAALNPIFSNAVFCICIPFSRAAAQNAAGHEQHFPADSPYGGKQDIYIMGHDNIKDVQLHMLP